MTPLRLLLQFVLVAFMGAAQAQQSALDRLDDWSEARGWEGVGLLIMNGSTTCTGALVRPDLVLTAAHCLFDVSDKRVEPIGIEFRAAWRDGQAISNRTGRHALIHPGYKQLPRPTGETIYHDLALVQLDAPVRNDVARPFDAGAHVGNGDSLTVVSYGRGRNDAASLEEACRLTSNRNGIFEMTCSIVPGSSGSPVFVKNGEKHIVVSVVSALGHNGLAYGMELSDHLTGLLADFDAGRGVYPAVVQTARRLSAVNSTGGVRQLSSGGGGALFLKP